MSSVHDRRPPRPGVGVALVIALIVTATGCGATGEDATGSSTSVPTPTSTTIDPTLSTLPPDAFGDITTDTLGTPDPPLPGDIRPEAFPVGALAALGNLQIRVTSVDQPGSDPAAPQRLTVRLDVTNGATDDLELRRSSFSVYLADGSAVPADDGSGEGITGVEIPSAATVSGDLTFTIPVGARPIMMLFDSAGSTERIYSGAFVVGV